MDRLQRKLLEQLLLWMERENKTFDDIAVKSKNVTLTYKELFDQIQENIAYGARSLKAYKMVKNNDRRQLD